VQRRVVNLVVDAEHDVRVGRLGALGGRRQDHLAGAGLEMFRGVGARAEPPGRLDDDVDAVFLPRQLGRVAIRGGDDLLVADRDHAVAEADAAGKRS
jgi:hypothetical protein